MPRIKKIKPPTISKLALLERLVEKPSQDVKGWRIKEFSLLKKLEEKWPLEFLNAVNFGKKLPSLAVLFSDWGQKELGLKHYAFNFCPEEKEQIILSAEKVGEDLKIEKKRTLRDIL